MLTWAELAIVFAGIQRVVNNGPLTYVVDGADQSPLTPNMLLGVTAPAEEGDGRSSEIV